MRGGINHLSMSRLNLKFKFFSNFLVGKNEGGINHLSMSRLKFKFKNSHWVTGWQYCWGSIIFPCPGWSLNLKFSVRFWSVIQGVNHLSMSKLNLKFKFSATFWLAKMKGKSTIFPWTGWILNSKFTLSYWLAILLGINHLSMSRLKFKFKIFSEILISDTGSQSSFHVQAISQI